MQHPNGARSCALYVLIPVVDHCRPDPSDLVAACGHRLGDTSVVVWADDADQIDVAAVDRAAMTLDLIEILSGRRPRYQEVCGDLSGMLRGAAGQKAGSVVAALTAGSSRRVVRAVRRTARREGAHVAFVPPSLGSARELMSR